MGGLIVLEGPRGVGKSTIAKEMVRLTNGTYIHHKAGDSTLDIIEKEICDYIDRVENEFIVVDRWWLSEYIYTPFHRRTTTLRYGTGYVVALESVENMFGGLVNDIGPRIILTQDPKITYERWRSKNLINRFQSMLPMSEFSYEARVAEVDAYDMLCPFGWSRWRVQDRTPEETAEHLVRIYFPDYLK